MSTPYLYTKDNPHADVRSNGKRFWGYPSRESGIRAIVIHTAETIPSSRSAWNVATWQRDAAAVPSSYHVMVDSHNTVRCLPDEATAFHVRGFNSPSLGLSFATSAHLWGSNRGWDEDAIKRGADQAREWMKLYGIPARWLTKAQADAGWRGLVRHSVMDPSRRSDPGIKFPAQEFIELLQPKAPTPTPTDPWETFYMSLTDKEKTVLKDFAAYLAGPNGTNGDSFARQFLIFNRTERGPLVEFLSAIEEMNSSARGQGRALAAMWREAGARGWERNIEKFRENRAYTEDDLK